MDIPLCGTSVYHYYVYWEVIMKKVLFGVVVGILTGIGIYAYAKQRAEDANDVDVNIVLDTDIDEM